MLFVLYEYQTAAQFVAAKFQFAIIFQSCEMDSAS